VNVTLPDGTVIKGVPDGTTKAQLLDRLASAKHPAARALRHEMAKAQVEGDPITQGAKNFAKHMPWWRQAAAGYGKAAPDIALGLGQITGLASDEDVEERKRLDAPLMNTGGGITGNIAGNAMLFAPTAAIPGAGTLPGAAVIGAASGAVQPVGKDESRSANAMVGGLMGAGGQLAGRVVGRGLKPISSRLGPEEAQLAQAAGREGIPLTAGQQTGSRPLQIAESVMENLPMTSGSQIAAREAQQRAFTAAALRRAGIKGDSAGGRVLSEQKQFLGSALGDIAENSKLSFDDMLTTKLNRIAQDARQHLPPAAAAKIDDSINAVFSQVGEGNAMTGTNYQGWREPLRQLAKGGDAEGHSYGQIRRALDEAFGAQVADPAWPDLSRQYANLKTITQAMGGPGNLPATGQIPPSQLGAALSNSIGREGKALGRGDLNELSRIGQTFVKDQIPNSGTAQRQMIQSLLTTGGGGVGGASLGFGGALATGNDPWEAAAYGGALGGAAMLTPKVIQSLMNSPAGVKYLTTGIVPIDEAGRKALASALQIGGMAAAPALAQ